MISGTLWTTIAYVDQIVALCCLITSAEMISVHDAAILSVIRQVKYSAWIGHLMSSFSVVMMPLYWNLRISASIGRLPPLMIGRWAGMMSIVRASNASRRWRWRLDFHPAPRLKQSTTQQNDVSSAIEYLSLRAYNIRIARLLMSAFSSTSFDFLNIGIEVYRYRRNTSWNLSS